MRAFLRSCAAALYFGGLAVASSFPLILNVSTRMPGGGLGDNTLFFWNFWWMRLALRAGADTFRTSYLFAPFGVDLALHTHTALPAWVGATVLRALPLTAALNVTILVGLWLNGYVAYLLARRLSGSHAAALIAGTTVSMSAYIAAHLLGHFNLIHVWPLALCALVVCNESRSITVTATLVALVIALTAYIDYYYVVYQVGIVLVAVCQRAAAWDIVVRRRPSPPTLLIRALTLLAIADLLIIGLIAWRGGFSLSIAGARVSARDTYNPLQIFWLLLIARVLSVYRVSLNVQRRGTWSWSEAARAFAVALAVLSALAYPLLRAGIRIWRVGDYVSQQYQWRSAPPGVDLGTVVLFNPFNTLWGSSVRSFYERTGIDLIEGGVWLGVVPVLLAAYACLYERRSQTVRVWTVIGALFLVWALGPHLRLFGRDTGVIMPQAVARLIPLVANARVPGRAVAVVQLALAVLASIGAVRWSSRRSRPALALGAALAVVVIDGLTAPLPLVSTACPPIYQTLSQQREEGALAELPLSFGDGLIGEMTPVDHQLLVCQAVHERPVVGGVLARTPPRLLANYLADPLLGTWLRLSSIRGISGAPGAEPATREVAGEQLRRHHIAFVLLDRSRASAALRDYVTRVLPLTELAHDDVRTLYVVTKRTAY